MNTDLTPDELAARYQLLCRSTQVEAAKDSQAQQIEGHLQALNKLLKHDLRALARRGSPDDFADIYFALEQELERFHEFCSFPALSQKGVVAFGGGFSAGKSSLINTLLGKRLLVTEVDPTTSLPTYLLKGKHDAVHAHNLFGHRIDLSNEEFLSLTHDEIERYGSNVSRLLRSAFITRADFPWNNLALIDTPGYTKHEDQTQGARTDEHIARTQLNAAQAIVWVIDARKGCITEDDLQFLASVQADIPRLIVVSRADQKPAEDISGIVAGIKATLSERNLPFMDVIPVSARQKQEWPMEPILKQLAAWSRQPRTLRFAHNFKAQFTRYARFIEEEQRQAQRHLNRLNRILVMTENQDVQADTEELKQQADDSLSAAKERAAELLGLRHRFFGDLKAIGDAVGIALPEPSEIDLLDTQGTDLLKLLTTQREQEGRAALEEPQALRDLMKPGETEKLSVLLGNGIEGQLNPHFAADLDIHSRETYARLLAALLTIEGTVSEAQSQLFKALLGTLQLDDIRASLFAQAKNLDHKELRECHRIINEHGLAKSCLLDALILCRLGKPQIEVFSEVADYLGVTQKEIESLSSLAGYVLGLHQTADYIYRDIENFNTWKKFIFKNLSMKILSKEINGGYFNVEKEFEIAFSNPIKNAVFIFKVGASLKIDDPFSWSGGNTTNSSESFYRTKHKINVEIENCIMFSAKMKFSNLLSIRIENSSFISSSNQGTSLPLLEINNSGKYKTTFESIKSDEWKDSSKHKKNLAQKGVCLMSNSYFEIGDLKLFDISQSSIFIEKCRFNDCSGLPLVVEAPAPEEKTSAGFFGILSSVIKVITSEGNWIRPGEHYVRIQNCDFSQFERNKNKILNRASDVINCI